MSNQDETASLLVGPLITSTSTPSNCSKPVLMRQECTTFLVSNHHPQLSVFSDSEDDGSLCFEESSARSVPDIELHCRYVLNQQMFIQMQFLLKSLRNPHYFNYIIFKMSFNLISRCSRWFSLWLCIVWYVELGKLFDIHVSLLLYDFFTFLPITSVSSFFTTKLSKMLSSSIYQKL